MRANIAIINASTVVDDATIASWLPALQTQLDRDYAAHWTWGGSPAALQFVPKGAKPPAFAWWLAILDDSDVAGALGYHDLTPSGQPLGKVFAATDLHDGLSISVTLDHELLEMLADADIATCVQHGDILYAREICDPCERDEQGYEIDGVKLSDFVLPSWFDTTVSGPTPDGPFDFRGLITQPRAILPGGYMLTMDLRGSTGWQQTTRSDERLAYRQLARVGSRRERRARGRARWMRSRVETC